MARTLLQNSFKNNNGLQSGSLDGKYFVIRFISKSSRTAELCGLIRLSESYKFGVKMSNCHIFSRFLK